MRRFSALLLTLALTAPAANARPSATMAPANGRIAFIQGCCSEWRILTVAPDGTDEQELTDGWHYEFAGDPSWSPDGTQIAFGAYSTRPGWRGREIGVMNADGSSIHAITHTRIGEYDPAWSPDGSMIIFARGFDLFTMTPEGTGRVRLTDSGREESEPEISPDGTRIAFRGRTPKGMDLYTMAIDGTDVQRLTRTKRYEGAPRWSADGGSLYYTTSRKTGPMEYDRSVWAFDIATATPTLLLGDPAIDESSAIPSPDGTKLAWVRGANDGDLTIELVISDPDGSNPTVTATCTMGCDFWDLDWQPLP